MNKGIFLSVRNKATRLPGKALLVLGGDSVTAQLLKRIQQSKQASSVFLTTSDHPDDDCLCQLAEQMGIRYFRGSQEDKLQRYLDAANKFDLDFMVIVEGDDPFVSIKHIDTLLQHAEERPVDFISYDNLPLGATGFGIRRSALETTCNRIDAKNTEVWGHLFTSNPDFNCVLLQEENACYGKPNVRMTLDYQEDYDFFNAVLKKGSASKGLLPSFECIMTILAKYPEIISINQTVQKSYEQHLQESLAQ
jgi:spore coat polysaccharide biosynthesis protein SpsF (cytidylyltransferase family)